MGSPPALDGWLKRRLALAHWSVRQWALRIATATSKKPSATAHAAIMSGLGPTRCAAGSRGRRRESRGCGAARSTSIRRWPGRISRTPRRIAGAAFLPATAAARRSPSLRRSIRSRTSSTSAHQTRASEARGIGGDANSASGGHESHRNQSLRTLREASNALRRRLRNPPPIQLPCPGRAVPACSRCRGHDLRRSRSEPVPCDRLPSGSPSQA
jgi:hypothetical protein